MKHDGFCSPCKSQIPRLRILGSYKVTRKSLKCLDLLASTQPTTQKLNFDLTFLVISHKKSAVKHPIEKSILLRFVNLSTTIWFKIEVQWPVLVEKLDCNEFQHVLIVEDNTVRIKVLLLLLLSLFQVDAK